MSADMVDEDVPWVVENGLAIRGRARKAFALAVALTGTDDDAEAEGR